MELTFSEEYEYTPVFNKNREEENPCIVRLRYLTIPEREECIKVQLVAVDGVMQRQTTFDNEKILRKSLVEIKGLEVNGSPVKSYKDLMAIRGLSGLGNEVADYAAGMNITPDLKN